MLACAWIGFALTTVGTLLAVLSLIEENQEHGGRRLLPTADAALAARRLWWRVRPRPGVRAEAAEPAEMRMEIPDGVLWVEPPADASEAVQITVLRQQVAALNFMISQQEERIHRVTLRVDAATQRAHQHERALEETNRKDRDLATSSLRVEMFGLLLVGIGSLVSLLPTVLGWT